MHRIATSTAALIILMLHGAPAARAEGDVAAGKKLAIENCSLCHVIGDHNPTGGINSTPSFWIFARKPEIYTERLRSFDQRRPHVALDFDLSRQEIKHIVAYVGGLKPE